MLNVMRIVFYVQVGILFLNMILSGTQTGNWLPIEAVTKCQLRIWVSFADMG